MQLLYSEDDVKERSTAGIQRAATPEEALAVLLRGSGLEMRRDGNAVVIFRAARDSAAAREEPAQLTSVTVTAQKRAQSAQSVPIAITALSGKSIETHRVQSLQDLARLTPGLTVAAFSQANPTVAIRGVSNTFSQIGVNKPVGIFVDDVFIPRNSAASFELYDLDSIAVLKGPQGTLFGRNVSGGAIVINSRQPNPEQREIEAEATAGKYGERQLKGLLNQPLNEHAAVKLSANLRQRDGLGRDRLTGREQDDIDSRNLRLQAMFRLAPELNATLGADYSEDRNGGRTLSSDTLGDDGDPRTSELGVEQRFARIISGVSAKMVWKAAGGEVTSITALRKSQSGEDYSGVGAHYSFLASGSQSLTRDADQLRTFSQELRYASPKWQAGDFVTGIYYSNEDGARQLAVRGLAAKSGALASSTLADQQVDSRSLAVFADGVLHLGDALDLTAGARYTRDRKSASLRRSDLVRPANDFSVGGLDAEWKEFTPRLVLSWRPLSGMMAYASATRGFTSGGFNADASSAAAFRTAFDPETVTSHEAGLKSQWLNNRLRLNAAVFRMKYSDKQELVNNTQTGILTIVNAAKATVEGAEVELAYKAARWLDLSASYGYLDGRYDRFVAGAINYSGNPLSNSPRKQAALAANFSYPLGDAGYLTGAASYAWKGSYNTGAANDPNLQLPGFGLFNLSAGIEAPDRSWRLLAWVKNANNTSYLLTRSTQVVRARYMGEPRTFGLTLSRHF
ncbi:TonB-dependent receptor [Massilia sp. BJB1822]|nr:TonB-dependent receptor [Massilia sp. BJB1822]